LNDREMALSTADIVIIGAAYKPNVSDTRESPAVDIVRRLENWKANVEYHDPFVPTLDVDGGRYESVPLTDERLQEADCTIIVTDHSTLDLDRIVSNSSLVFDTRNATADLDIGGGDIVRL
jgi:UDP-N-acetyl-D-glucosamine dehydrogenase